MEGERREEGESELQEKKKENGPWQRVNWPARMREVPANETWILLKFLTGIWQWKIRIKHIKHSLFDGLRSV